MKFRKSRVIKFQIPKTGSRKIQRKSISKSKDPFVIIQNLKIQRSKKSKRSKNSRKINDGEIQTRRSKTEKNNQKSSPSPLRRKYEETESHVRGCEVANDNSYRASRAANINHPFPHFLSHTHPPQLPNTSATLSPDTIGANHPPCTSPLRPLTYVPTPIIDPDSLGTASDEFP